LPVGVVQGNDCATRINHVYSKNLFDISLKSFFELFFSGSLMQQTCPWLQELPGRPPNKEQTAPGVQIPSSPLGDVQVLKVPSGLLEFGFTEMGTNLARVTKGLHVFAGVNLLLKRPVLTRLAPKPPNRPSSVFSFSSFGSGVELIS
jgi:hypothetical protein